MKCIGLKEISPHIATDNYFTTSLKEYYSERIFTTIIQELQNGKLDFNNENYFHNRFSLSEMVFEIIQCGCIEELNNMQDGWFYPTLKLNKYECSDGFTFFWLWNEAEGHDEDFYTNFSEVEEIFWSQHESFY